ncbi:MAG: alpha/beta fold hydrolase [Thermoanaerobaculia bacterium]|nr:alpha/beta fold hydrolase [Thermoanaerobaculia bacterium]
MKPSVLRRPLAAALVAIWAASAVAQEPGPRSEAVEYANADVQLAAELLLPDVSGGPVPGAVIIQGSGSSDRTNSWARSIAEELVRNGLAVLLTDKRGSGASQGDWRTCGFGELAADALAGVRHLAARDDVDGSRVGLVGLSQGGWVAPIAAAAFPEEVAFVVNLSGAAVSFAEQSFHEMTATARQAGYDEAGVDRVLEINRRAGHALMSAGAWEAYAEARQKAIDGGLEGVAAGFPGRRDAPIWTFLRRVWDFDPMPYWILLRQPVLVVYGTLDESDNVPVAESVRRLEFAFAASRNERAEIVAIEGAGHGLRDPDTHGLHPRLREILAGWLAEHAVEADRAPDPESG